MTVARIGILGAGTMGTGIAQLAALGGFETRLYDAMPKAAVAGAIRLGEAFADDVTRNRRTDEEADEATNLVAPVEELEELLGCDLLIEAAPEDVELKRHLFTAAAAACGPETILATNTSSLRVADVAAGVPNPERVVGMHFFNPPTRMKLVEVVAAPASSERALDAVDAVAERMGRTPIRARDTPGFVANRLARPFALESLRMLGDGVADVETIDRIVRLGGGFRMGPFELIDLIGLDVNLSIARSFYRQGGEPERWRPSPIQERLVEEGKLGRKSGEGYYTYTEDPGSAVPLHRSVGQEHSGAVGPTLDPAALAEIDPSANQILGRLFAQIANEAAFALEEDVASPADMDTATRLGLNWPRGSLQLADLIGARPALELLEELEREKGAAYEPASLLREAAAGDRALRDLAEEPAR